MTLPTSYLTSTKRLPDILAAIHTAQAPESFSTRFLENLGFKTKVDRLVIGVLKSLAFLDDNGKPTDRYYEYLDQSRSEVVLAIAIRDAYSDLFALNRNAHKFTKQEFVGKAKTLTQGQLSDRVLSFMYSTFAGLVELADFETEQPKPDSKVEPPPHQHKKDTPRRLTANESPRLSLDGLVYNIQIVLPETRDPAVYDALFRSLREHLS